MQNVSIRKAKSVDAQSLANCFASAYSAFKSKIPDLPDVSDGLLAAIAEKSVWVAEIDGALVGGVVLDLKDDYLILENVAVHPNTSGAGVGKTLIQKAELECRRLALREIRLSTHKEMSENVGLYQHLGWRVVSVVGNKVNMTKPIGQTE